MALKYSSDAQPKILVFHIGSLGDTLIALPAMWAVRTHHPQAHITLLTKTSARPGIPVGEDILQGSPLFDAYKLFNGDYHAYGRNLSAWEKAREALRLWWWLRQQRFDTVVYLAPSVRDRAQIQRDLRFFRAAGITHVIGARELDAVNLSRQPATPPLPMHPREAQWMLDRLSGSEVRPPALTQARRDLALSTLELQQALEWMHAQGAPSDRPWIALAPGTNLPSKRWPLERFAEVGQHLMQEFDIWPVVMGGAEDVDDAQHLLNQWGRGTLAANRLSVRQSAAVLQHCSLYVGNDTGVMHLAASADVPCVAIFSARDLPGKWHPLGSGHTVMRSSVPCEGCMLVRCEEHERRCLTLIGVQEVSQHAARILRHATQHQDQPPARRQALP